jgi:hypothetical protein
MITDNNNPNSDYRSIMDSAVDNLYDEDQIMTFCSAFQTYLKHITAGSVQLYECASESQRVDIDKIAALRYNNQIEAVKKNRDLWIPISNGIK